MQSLARPGSSSLSWAGCSRQCAPNCRQRTSARRVQAPVTAYAVSQASQSSSGGSSSSQDNERAGRDASDTIRSLDSILGSTDDTEDSVDRAQQLPSTSASSVQAFSGSSAAVSLQPSRSQGNVSRDFQGATTPSRLAASCKSRVLRILMKVWRRTRLLTVQSKHCLGASLCNKPIPACLQGELYSR